MLDDGGGGRGEEEGEDEGRGEEQADWADGGGDNMVCNGLPLDPSIRQAATLKLEKCLELKKGVTYGTFRCIDMRHIHDI